MTRIAIAGVGKIARDQHIPHILANPDLDYVAAVTRGATKGHGVPAFNSIPEMMAANLGVEAIAICSPPISRMALLADALAAKLDVLMEKPPAATLSEAEHFSVMAQEAGGLLYQSWHSREAAAVEPARDWLKGRRSSRCASIGSKMCVSGIRGRRECGSRELACSIPVSTPCR